MRTTTILVCGTLALFAACRGSDDNNGTDAGSGSGSGSAVTIQDVQSTNMPAGTPVSLKGVVVTAIDAYGTKTGDMWVEEPEGGQYSGVHVYNAPLTTVASLAPGDIVDIAGAEKSEFALSTDTTGRTLTELEPVSGGVMTVTKTGTGSLPPIAQVDALMIGQLSDVNNNGQRSAAWGAWEGVLIQLTNVSAFGAPKCVGSACSDATDQQFSITGDAEVESELAAFPTGITLDSCLGNVTGVVDYFFDYLILPRTTADVATGGNGCTFENAAAGGTECTDGIDNDGNGFIDCADLGCEVGSAAWLGASCGSGDATCGCSKNYAAGSSISAANAAEATTSSAVYLHDVYVTALGTSTYWVADNLGAAASGGMYVFSKPPTGVTVGQKLATLQGVAGPFPSSGSGAAQMELEDATAGSASAGGTVTPITAATVTTLIGLTTGAPYAGSLVQVGPVKMKAVGAHNQATFEDNSNAIITMDDDAFFDYGGSGSAAPPYTVGSCYQIVGVMDLQTTDQVRTINPRTLADVTTTTGCTGN